MRATWKALCPWVLALGAESLMAATRLMEPVSVSIDPKEAYIETRGAEQRLNFDLLLYNPNPQPLRISKVEVSVYDAQGTLAFRRYIDENGTPCGVCTVPQRIVPANSRLDLFNPFHTFPAEMPLATLHYTISFAALQEPQPNLLNFASEVALDIHPTRYEPKTPLRLPLKGRIYVFDGHDYYAHHRRQDVFRKGNYRPNSVRYGYDLTIMDSSGNLYQADRFKKENWLSYGAPVFAPAAGTVIDAANDIPDNSYDQGHVVYPELPKDVDPVGLGNHVTLDFGGGEFCMLLHLKPGSVTVKKGDVIVQGQQLGAIGFSGDSFLPHLHTMVMSGPDASTSQGLPSYFNHFKRVLGVRLENIDHGQIDSGDILEYSPPCAVSCRKRSKYR